MSNIKTIVIIFNFLHREEVEEAHHQTGGSGLGAEKLQFSPIQSEHRTSDHVYSLS